ncbi:MAG: hypothetical protein HYY44_00460 [Deltaproteobacteria bacterium]|nr:hypothetical protein [Deltaproteobacteria bacterium]
MHSGVKLARSEYKYGKNKWIEIKPKKPLPARSSHKRAALTPVTNDLKALLDPITRTGMIDTAKIPAKNFREFVDFLKTHAGINDNKSFSNPYQNLLSDEKYWPLLELLYEERNPDSISPLDNPQEASELLLELTADLIQIDSDAFVQSQISTPKGRKRVREILLDKKHFDLKIRAAICKAMPRAAETIVRSSATYEISSQFGFIDDYLDYGNFLVSDEQVAKASSGVFKALQAMEEAYRRVEERRSQYREEPGAAIGVTKRSKALGFGEKANLNDRLLEVRDAERFVAIATETEDQKDLAGQLKNRLAHLWLFAADSENWRGVYPSFDFDWSRVNQARLHLLRGVEEILPNIDQVKNDRDLKAINDQIQSLLTRPLNLDGNALKSGAKQLLVGDSIQKALGTMKSHIRAPLDNLAQFSDEIAHSYDMGESLYFERREIRLENPHLKKGVTDLIDSLVRTKQQLWYGYKQHRTLSRGGSQVRRSMTGGGDITDIQQANRLIDKYLIELQGAYSVDHVEQIVEKLYDSLKEGGPLHAALVAAEMDGTEQLSCRTDR